MANLLTGLRLLLVAPVAWAFALPGSLPALLLLALIFIAITTDYYDGIVARKTGSASASGMLFDHSTDFIFVTSSLAGAAYAGLISPLLPALIVVAFSQYVLDSYFLFRQKRLRMSFLGRWNGIFYFVPLVVIAVADLPGFETIETFLLELVAVFGFGLIATTIASIFDRAIAPLRQPKVHE